MLENIRQKHLVQHALTVIILMQPIHGTCEMKRARASLTWIPCNLEVMIQPINTHDSRCLGVLAPKSSHNGRIESTMSSIRSSAVVVFDMQQLYALEGWNSRNKIMHAFRGIIERFWLAVLRHARWLTRWCMLEQPSHSVTLSKAHNSAA